MFQAEQLQIKQIDSYPDKVGGIYAWFYKPKKIKKEGIDKLRMLYSSLDLSLYAKSTIYRFKDEIVGGLHRKHYRDESLYSEDELNFLRTFIVNHGMPIYIGRTRNFRNRLRQHLECFEQERSTLVLSKLNEADLDPEINEEIDLNDTNLESSLFGRRLARINRDQWLKINDIYIYLYKFNDGDLSAVKRCEYYLNRLYRPILGNV